MSDVVALSKARAMLAEAETVEACQDVARMAKVAEALAREADLGVTAQNAAVLLRAEAYAKAADLLPDASPKNAGRNGIYPDTITKLQVQRWRDGRAALRAGWPDTLDPDHELTWTQIHRQGHKIRLGTSDQPDDFYTPAWLFDRLAVTFDLDPCAAPGAHVPARTYYTQQDDGLTQPWHGLVWVNPPYSQPEQWAHRFTEHGNGLWLSLLRNGGWLIPLLDQADVVRIWVQPKFTTANGGTMTAPGAHVLIGMGDGAEPLATADLGPKVSRPL